MKHLYIIGNGFDIHHDIPSSYKDFHQWIEENDKELLAQMQEFFIDSYDSTWWKDFEHNLSSLDAYSIIYTKVQENYPNIADDNFSDSEWYDAEHAVERQIDDIYSAIEIAFRKWVNTLPEGNSQKKISMILGSHFLSFNYTDTLESLYGINSDNILYIHGRVKETSKKLILGHGTTKKQLHDLIRIDAVEDDSTLDLITSRAKETAITCIANKRKNVEQNIEENKKWFDTLFNITHIHIYGFSLSDIDMPYMFQIINSVNRELVTIEFSFKDAEDKDRISYFINKFNIVKYKLIELSDLQSF